MRVGARLEPIQELPAYAVVLAHIAEEQTEFSVAIPSVMSLRVLADELSPYNTRFFWPSLAKPEVAQQAEVTSIVRAEGHRFA
jgi:hypothetical protein